MHQEGRDGCDGNVFLRFCHHIPEQNGTCFCFVVAEENGIGDSKPVGLAEMGFKRRWTHIHVRFDTGTPQFIKESESYAAALFAW